MVGRVASVRGFVAAVALSGAAAAGMYAWWWVHQERALEAHLQEGHARVPRLLEVMANLPGELAETSGLAVSRTNPGVVWSHNDSGNEPLLYALDLSGRLLGTTRVRNAANLDWEDMSAGPCPRAVAETARQGDRAGSCLYIGDIGDNRWRRPELTVYVVEEPLLGAEAELPDAVRSRSFRFRYSSRHDDSEALAVDADGDVVIVTKGRSGIPGFFRIPADRVAHGLQSGETLVAVHEMNLPVRMDHEVARLVTGAAFSPDGRTLAVRTYHEVFFFRPSARGAAPGWELSAPPCFLGNAEPQGEAIDYLSDDTLLLTSERSRGRAAQMHRLQC
jgi:hypothetical protein